VSNELEGYAEIPEEERKKAKAFFDRAAAVAGTGNYDYAVELYLNGLGVDPDSVEAHQSLRDVSLKRKASGGKAMGMFERMKHAGRGKDDKQNMLAAERMLAYDPGNTDYMQQLLQSAHRAGYWDTVLWIGPIFLKANADSPRPDFNKFIVLKDVYKAIKRWKLANDACQYAAALRPDDMDLQNELKNLGAQQTMEAGRYGEAGSFRESVRDSDSQQRLLEQDKGVLTEDVLTRNIREAEAELAAEPTEPGKLMKLVDALVKTEQMEHENRAIEMLEQWFVRTKQFRFRWNAGQIKLRQLSRMERSMRAEVARNPADADLKKSYAQFLKEKAEEELKEYQLAIEAYPTDLALKYQVATRLFELERYDEAIPRLQESLSDAKVRTDATLYLGRAFLEAGFNEEASDTLKGLIEAYQVRGDNKSKDMHYWYGRALEAKGDMPLAIKNYSQVAQWDFNYRDVQTRIKTLRAKQQTPPSNAG
jgi:thioredoxin-like negative regulator of GroEL